MVVRPRRAPLLPRLLRIRHLRLTGWQRVLFGDVPLGLGLLLAMAGFASNWIIVALPACTLAMVKLHDVVSGQLAASSASRQTDNVGALHQRE